MHEEDSMDELANNMLLSRQSEESPRHSPLKNVNPAGLSRSKTNISTAGYFEKPLPAIPRDLSTVELNPQHQRQPPMVSKTANPNVIRKGGKRSGRPKISHPIPVVIEPLSDAAPVPEADVLHPRHPNMLKRSMTEMGNLNTKPNRYLDHAKLQEAERFVIGKRSVEEEKASRLSPLQRGRQAFVVASRAIADRLNRSSSTSRMGDKKFGLSAKGDSPPDSSHGSILSLRPNTDDDSSWGRHNRRIAEGENLGRPKIQAMTSDGQIRRKPLPLQEGMMLTVPPSPPHRREAPPSVSGEKAMDRPYNDSERDFNLPENRHSSDGETSSQFDNLQIKPSSVMKQLPPATQKSFEYLVVNGLAQHPDTLVFASPPVVSSPPKRRSERQANMDSQRRVASGNKSTTGFGDRGEDDRAAQTPVGTHSRVTSNGNQSVKRKSATRDLRSQLSLAMKRTKRGSIDSSSSKEELFLGTGPGQRDKADRPGLIAREKNRLNVIFNKPGAESMEFDDNGFNLLDVSKENEPIPFAEDKSWVTHTRGSGGKKSATPRRPSVFSRESRAQTLLIDTSEGGDMDIDELQTNDLAYQVRERMR